MNSYLNYKTIGAACGIGVLAYCLYFDKQRRSAPDYREKVRARRERLRKAEEEDIQLPHPDDKEALEKFFVKSIELGEELMQLGKVDKAIQHLSYAVVFCPQPQHLLKYLREMLPTEAYHKLTEQLVVANKRFTETYSKRNEPEIEEVE